MMRAEEEERGLRLGENNLVTAQTWGGGRVREARVVPGIQLGYTESGMGMMGQSNLRGSCEPSGPQA